jgi:DnaJ domain/DNA-J related protein
MEPAWDHAALRAWFSARPGDVLETDLLRAFFPDQPLGGEANLELYRKHFLLYRRLWLFDEELRLSSGHRLWIRGIRSTLLEPPPEGRCAHLNTDTGRYCLEPLDGHCPIHDPTVPETNSMKSYYLDPSHLDGMTEAGVQELMDRFFGWWGHRSHTEAALGVLGLAPDADEKAIKARWRVLSLEHHPDRGGDPVRFKKISAAWTALKRKKRD